MHCVQKILAVAKPTEIKLSQASIPLGDVGPIHEKHTPDVVEPFKHASILVYLSAQHCKLHIDHLHVYQSYLA